MNKADQDSKKISNISDINFNIADSQVAVIVGHCGSGKTLMSYSILDQITDRKKYILDHPYPKALKNTGLENMVNFDVDKLVDAAIYIDEAQLIMAKHQKRQNESLMMLASLARQRNIFILISTSDTRWVNKGLESYVSFWGIKDIEYDEIKQGSKIKNIIRKYSNSIMPENFRLEKNEAIIYWRGVVDRPAKVQIPMPKYWNEELSKPYRYALNQYSQWLFNQGNQ